MAKTFDLKLSAFQDPNAQVKAYGVVPGLAVHRRYMGGITAGWAISHVASGLSVSSTRVFLTKTEASDVAKKLGSIGIDWTVADPDELKDSIRDRDLRDTMNKALRGF